MRKSIFENLSFLSLVTYIFFGGVFSVSAATLSINPASGNFNVGKNFTVSVSVDGVGEAVNTSEAIIKYDSTALSVVSVSKDGSGFSMWSTEPAFDNTKGEVTYGGGSPSGFSGKKSAIAIVFKGLKEGSTEVSFSAGSVLAADGKGTDVLTAKTPATFTLGKATVTETLTTPTTPTLPSTGGGTTNLPAIPVITSITHPDPEKWYKANLATFKWSVPRDVDNVRILLDDSPRSVPSISNTPPISEKEFKDVADGTKYFHVMFHNKSGWGTPAHRQVLIDTTPPEKFSIESRSDSPNPGDTSLIFLVKDKSSGLAYYDIAIDGAASSTRLELKDVSDKGDYKLDTLPVGDHTVVVHAYDKVGNMAEGKGSFTVVKATPVVAATGDQIVVQGASPIPYWLSFIFLAIAVFIGSLLYSERRKFVKDTELIKGEADEAADKLGKIFTALRDEVEEQIHNLSGKPTLTNTEREILESIKEAIDVSEELLEKEIEDVRKLLR